MGKCARCMKPVPVEGNENWTVYCKDCAGQAIDAAVEKPSVKPTRREPVPQPHGGALIPGAGGGPQPGSGRPASEIRERMRGALAERIHIAEEIADNPQSAPADRMRALDFLAKHGMPVQQEISGPDGSPLLIEDKRAEVKRLLKEKKLKVVKE